MECNDGSCKMESNATCGCSPNSSHGQCGCSSNSSHSGCGGEHGSSHHLSSIYKRAFFEALHEAQVERIKKRIDATMGPTLDKTADAVIESFSKIWQSKLLQSESKKELESKLHRILSESRG